MLIGSHIPMRGREMLLGAAEMAANFGESTFMIYTGAPQNTKRKAIEDMKIEEGQAFMKAHGLSHLVVHAPYIINLANNKDEDKYQFTIDFLREEIKRAEALGATQITLHPGSHVGLGQEQGIENIINGLNAVLTEDQIPQIALETMAGKGTELGRTFEEIKWMIDGVKYQDKVSVTMDTCHIHDAGYDVKHDFDGVLEEFDRVVGLDKLKVMHINDSKNPQGAHKDRHENLGYGYIGFDALSKVVYHPKLEDKPKILETPYLGEKKEFAPYKEEIQMLEANRFDSDWREKYLKTHQ